MQAKERQNFTPPALAARYGIKPEKVLCWIRSGELAAINIATNLGGRPRYLITREAVQTFEARRAVVARRPSPRAVRRRDPEVIDFF